MKSNTSERLASELSKLLNRILEYSKIHLQNEQIFGTCIVNPKEASTPPPTKQIQAELKNLITSHFQQLGAIDHYCHYWNPPFQSNSASKEAPRRTTVDDYQITCDLLKFDRKWQQVIIARSLIYCPLDQEQHGWNEWFEPQLEAVRLVLIIHKTLEELNLKSQIQIALTCSSKPIFESFIYEYALTDSHFSAMTTQEKALWKNRKIEWKIRYRLAADVIKETNTLKDLYRAARGKANSTRNPMLKSLFSTLVDRIESRLIMNADLPKEDKQQLIFELRDTKNRSAKNNYMAKRPAVAISDVECGQMLCLLVNDLFVSKNKAIAETILFILISQHAAFSGLQTKEKDILAIRIHDINNDELTILIGNQEMNVTGGLNEILIAWIGESERKNNRLFFHKLTYDVLEDIIKKFSTKLYGSLGKLLPRDFLEKVHVIAGTRLPLDIRRQITEQEDLMRNSPYRIDVREIEKQIKKSIRQ